MKSSKGMKGAHTARSRDKWNGNAWLPAPEKQAQGLGFPLGTGTDYLAAPTSDLTLSPMVYPTVHLVPRCGRLTVCAHTTPNPKLRCCNLILKVIV